MRIRTLRERLRRGHKFTAWLRGLRVTLSTPESLDQWPDHGEQREIAGSAVDVTPPGGPKELEATYGHE